MTVKVKLTKGSDDWNMKQVFLIVKNLNNIYSVWPFTNRTTT